MLGPLEEIGGNVFAWLRDTQREEEHEAFRDAPDEEPSHTTDEG